MYIYIYDKFVEKLHTRRRFFQTLLKITLKSLKKYHNNNNKNNNNNN